MITRQQLGRKLSGLLSLNQETQGDLAHALGISTSAVSAWVQGDRFPRVEALNAICEHFGIETEELLDIKPLQKSVPVLGHVHAGQTTYAIEEILDYVDIGSLKASQGEYFGLYVEGDSMLPELHDGDLVIVRKFRFCLPSGRSSRLKVLTIRRTTSSPARIS